MGAKSSLKRSPGRSQIEVRKQSKLKTAKPLKSQTVVRISMFFEVPRSLLGAKTITTSGLGTLGSTFQPSWGSWRLPRGSWRNLGALLAILGVLLERLKGCDPFKTSSGRDQVALGETPAMARGDFSLPAGSTPSRSLRPRSRSACLASTSLHIT